MEIWKDVVGYESIYQVSNYGNVRSLNRTIKKYNNIMREITDFNIEGKLLSQKLSKDGYKSVSFSKDGISKHFRVHCLIMYAFVGNRPNNYVIRHLDGNKTNNVLDNLKYGTKSENSYDSLMHNTCYFKYGEKHPMSKLKLEDVNFIRENKDLFTNVELSKKFNVSRQTIEAVIHNKNWAKS